MSNKKEKMKYVSVDLGLKQQIEKVIEKAKKEYPGEQIEIVLDIGPDYNIYIFYGIHKAEGPSGTAN